jgi:hypothetical protein
MNVPPFRASRFIDFNSGVVLTAPMDLKATMTKPWTLDQKIDLFECRVEVWQFGVAAAILKQIEAAKSPSIWSHAAYALVSVGFSYFEMIGKTLNPNSKTSKSASEDFNYGFCNMYPKFTPANGVYTDKLPQPSGMTWPPNPDIQTVIAFRDRIRNGLYHLGYTKNGLWLHNDPGKDDFQIVPEPNSSGQGVIDHFPGFVADLRSPAKNLQTKFVEFFDRFHMA